MLNNNTMEPYFVPEEHYATIEGYFESYKYMCHYIEDPPYVTPEIAGVATDAVRVQSSNIANPTPTWMMKNESIREKVARYKKIICCLTKSITLAVEEECLRPAQWAILKKALKDYLFHDVSIYDSSSGLYYETICKYAAIAYFKAYELLSEEGLIEEI